MCDVTTEADILEAELTEKITKRVTEQVTQQVTEQVTQQAMEQANRQIKEDVIRKLYVKIKNIGQIADFLELPLEAVQEMLASGNGK